MMYIYSNNDKLPNADGITREPHEAIMVFLVSCNNVSCPELLRYYLIRAAP